MCMSEKEEMMRRFVVALLGATVMGVGAASAADLPVKAPPAPAPVPPYNWTGLYVGINGGGAWGHSSFAYVGGVDVGHNNNGGLVGGTIGYNYQVPSNWLFGLEADWDWADINGSSSCPNTAFNCDTKIDSIGTFRGRVGYAWDAVLLYATGGLAWEHVNVETVNLAGLAVPTSGTPTNGTKKWNDGWTVGAGVEYGFWTNWSVKLEYLYADFGTHTYTVDNALQVNSRQHENIVRVGVNYRFNWM
jgi:outer membrane immunogenic protein